MNTASWLSVETIPRFKDPLTALLWGSRVYLVHASSGEPVPPVLNLLFSSVLSADTQTALVEVLDYLMYHSTVPLAIHDLNCECVSAHEQALADGVRAIQAGSLSAYCAAFTPVLIQEDAMAIGPVVQVVAHELRQIEQNGFIQSANVVAPRAFAGKNTDQAFH